MKHCLRNYTIEDLLAAHRSQHRTPTQIYDIEHELRRRLNVAAAVDELSLAREHAEAIAEEKHYSRRLNR